MEKPQNKLKKKKKCCSKELNEKIEQAAKLLEELNKDALLILNDTKNLELTKTDN